MKTFLFRPFSILCALLIAAPLLRAAEPADRVLQAMRDELARSTAQLQLENLGKPYFIAYTVEERSGQNVAATFGSTTNRSEGRGRSLSVEVRVGSPALDNTNFQAGTGFSMMNMPVSLPLDDNYTELRRQLWLATDRAYKQAVENLSKKKAALENKNRTDETPDFSSHAPATITDLHPGQPLDLKQAEALVTELSAVFREMPAVATSNVRLGAGRDLTRYVNSEGSSFSREKWNVSLIATAATQAPDGASLGDHVAVYARSWAELPAKSELLARLRELGQRLTTLGAAPLLEQYNGPVLFEDQAAVEIFAQVFARQLAATKPGMIEDTRFSSALGRAENPFLDKIGARVLPDFLSVTDDATLTKLGNTPLYGDARVDDDGVPTQPVKLIENGRLKTLLVTRAPVRGVLQSTGSRHGSGPNLSNLIVTASEGRDAAALKAELLKNVQQRNKEFGVIVRRLGDPLLRAERTPIMLSPRSSQGTPVEPAVLAYKVYPDGREELLRNVEIADLNAQGFKDILAAGRDPFVLTIPYRAASGFSPMGGTSTVSFAVPSLLFEDVTLKKPSGEIPKPPIAKHPYFEK
jgi:hypothetical protein